MDDRLQITRGDEGIFFEVKALPRASREEITGVLGGKLKIKVTAPPVSGKANTAIIQFLARILGIKKQDVQLVRGETSAHKQFFIRNPDSDLADKLQQLAEKK